MPKENAGATIKQHKTKIVTTLDCFLERVIIASYTSTKFVD
jgi:hypothetical protein